MKPLSRNDIVGHTIKRVLCSPWVRNGEFESCQTFVELDDEVCFPLEVQSPFQEGLIYPIQIKNLQLVEEIDVGHTYDLVKILEVVCSESWATLGLLLSNNTFLIGDVLSYGAFGRYGTAVYAVGEFYNVEEIFTYWEHNPIAHFAK